MAAIDFVFLGIVVLFVLRCAVRGLVSEVMSLAAIVFGFLSALFFFRAAGEFVRARFMPGVAVAPEAIAFAALFIAVFILARILESILRGIIDGFGLNKLDSFLGALLGLAEGLVVVCLVLLLISVQPFFDSGALLGNSLFAELLLPLIVGRRWGLPPAVARAGGFALV